MTDHEPVIPLSERVKPQQLTRSDLKGLTAEEINQARMAGQLEDALSGKKPAPVDTFNPASEAKLLATDIVAHFPAAAVNAEALPASRDFDLDTPRRPK